MEAKIKMAENFARYTLTEEQRKRFSEYARYDTLRRASNVLDLPNGVPKPSEADVNSFRKCLIYNEELWDMENRGYATHKTLDLATKAMKIVGLGIDAEFMCQEPNLSMVHDFLSASKEKYNIKLSRVLSRGLNSTSGGTQ
jgi:hypothetical protein